jgi:TolB-like protein/Flp pilus assembly protein TadD
MREPLCKGAGAQPTPPCPMPEDLESNLKLEIAHVLLIDVVGYSKLLVNEQIDVLQTLNAIVRNTAQFRAAEASGKLMRLPTGDGMALLFFESAEAPVECALEIARAATELPHLPLRMGAHSGPIKQVIDVNDRANFAGAGINLAQRVLDCGDAGHILLSKRLAEDLSSYRHWHPYLRDLGECEVKHGVRMHLFNLCKDGVGNPHVPEKLRLQQRRLTKLRSSTGRWLAHSRWRKLAAAAVAVCVIAALVAGLTIFSRPPAGRSIAVLPFGNLSDEKSNTYFVDGVQDEILADLSKVRGLKVISRTSVMQYKPGLDRDLRAIARRLNVSHVLEGNVQRIGNRVRVHAQLIEADTDAHIWAERYDGELADVFAIQSEIAERIVAQLRLRLSPEEKAAVDERPTDDILAFELYTRAKALIQDAVFSARAQEDLNEAVALLTQAVARDPKFFHAFYQLAHAHDQLYSRLDRTPARLALAESAINKVRELRPASGEAHLATAKHLYWAYSQFDQARAELAIAARLLPNDPTAPLLTAYIERRQARWADSTRNFNRALELDPQNEFILQQLALTYFNQRQFPEMIRTLDRAVALAPENIVARVQRAAAEVEWRADTRPLEEAIAAAVTADPAAAPIISDQWIDVAIRKRDAAAAERALAHLSQDGCEVESVPFPRSWCEGLAARNRGDEEAARRAFTSAREQAAERVRSLPNDAGAASVLGMTQAALGEKEDAIRAGIRATELEPISKDALDGPLLVGFLAIIYAWTGEKDLALDQLKRVTEIPSYWSYGNLVLHPYWDPLRGDPRFEKIVASLAPQK